jgi:hypothetical protein
MGLPPFADMVADAFGQVLLAPEGSVTLMQKANIWANAQDEIKQRVFDRVRGPLYEMAERLQFDPAKTFPPPPGMEDYRQAHPPGSSAAPGQPNAPQIEQK